MKLIRTRGGPGKTKRERIHDLLAKNPSPRRSREDWLSEVLSLTAQLCKAQRQDHPAPIHRLPRELACALVHVLSMEDLAWATRHCGEGVPMDRGAMASRLLLHLTRTGWESGICTLARPRKGGKQGKRGKWPSPRGGAS